MVPPLTEGLPERLAKTICIGFFIFLLSSSAVYGYEWNGAEGLEGWRFSAEKIQHTEEGSILIFGESDGEKFGLATPEGVIDGESSVRIRLRMMGPGASVLYFTFIEGDKRENPVSSPFVGGRRWREYSIDIPDSSATRRIGFLFEGAEAVEIKDVSIYRPGFSDLFRTQGLMGYSVNFLRPFALYGHSLNLWFYAVIASSGAAMAIYYSMKKKKGILLGWGTVFLACSLLFGVREAYEEFDILDTTYEEFTSAPPGEKKFHHLTNLIDFAGFIQHNVPSEAGELYYFGHQAHYLYLKYLLYPRKLIQRDIRNDALGKTAIYYYTSARAEGDKIIDRGRSPAKQGRALAYSPAAFLYYFPD
jgi:hypothetical protein